MPERVIDTAEYHEPAMQGMRPPGDVWIGISGLDLVRDADGRFQVLEDNVRTPSGFSYAAAARRALAAQLDVAPGDAPRPLDDAPRAAAPSRSRPPRPPTGAPAPRCSPTASTTPPTTSTSGPPRRSASRCSSRRSSPRATTSTSSTGARTRTGSTPPVGRLLLEPMRAGPLGVVNAFGTGVADDKLTHAYVEDMIRFYLDEEPLLPSVETFDLGRPEILERAMDVFDELVIKPRGGYGGQGVAILPHAEPWDVEAVREAVLERPTAFVAQRMVMLSCHPTVIDGKLAPRHVDLRPYVFLGRDGEARVAARAA